MRKFTLIDIQWNYWNGFNFELIGIETDRFEGELFAIWIGSYFIVSLFFFRFEIKSPFYQQFDKKQIGN